MLVVRGVDKAYGELRALASVSLTIAKGEAVLLVGRNGAGKTTLLRIVTGFLDPDAGAVTIDGHPMETARARAQAVVGYLPEHAPAPAESTVRAHLWLRARQKGLSAATARAELDRVVVATELATVLERPIGTLSKGFRQRVGLADALLGAPPLLLLDEPTSGMDPVQTRALCDHLIAAARDRAVLVSSHAVADLERLATRVVVLRAGRVVADDTPATLCAQAEAATLEQAVVALLEDAA